MDAGSIRGQARAKLCNPVLVPATFIGRGQKDRKAVPGDRFRGHTGTKGKHIGVIVLAAKLRRLDVMDKGGADARMAVCSNGDPDTRATDQNPTTSPACLDFAGEGGGKIGIVNRFRPVSPKIKNRIAMGNQVLPEGRLEAYARVVAGNGNRHLRRLEGWIRHDITRRLRA